MANEKNLSLKELKDSGTRQEFPTGAVRDSQDNRGRYDLLPFHALYRLSVIFEKGAKKYSQDNWRKGIPMRRYFNSAMRHLCKLGHGHRDEDHAAQAMWNIACLIETEYMINAGMIPKELNDMPMYADPNDPSIAMDAPKKKD